MFDFGLKIVKCKRTPSVDHEELKLKIRSSDIGDRAFRRSDGFKSVFYILIASLVPTDERSIVLFGSCGPVYFVGAPDIEHGDAYTSVLVILTNANECVNSFFKLNLWPITVLICNITSIRAQANGRETKYTIFIFQTFILQKKLYILLILMENRGIKISTKIYLF